MSARICLRCDWHGDTSGIDCPACGAPLFRPGEPGTSAAHPVRRAHADHGARPDTSRGSIQPAPGTAEPTGAAPSDPDDRRSRVRAVAPFAVTAFVLLLVIDTILNSGRPEQTRSSARPLRLSGTLVYAVPDGRAWSRLWRWDLTTGQVERGPRVPEAIGLLSIPGANTRWVGLTSELPSGGLEASVVRSLGPKDRGTRVIAGDLVVWDPSGRSVAAVDSVALNDPCRRRVSITWARVVPAIRQAKYDDPSLCGDVLSLGVDDTATYFTLERRGNVGIYLAGVHRIHPILPGHALVSMSAVSDMVVVPASSLPGVTPLVIRPEQEHNDLPDAGLFFRGQGAHLLTGYGVGEDRLAIDGVLAWSSDGLVALADGLLGRQRGLFEIRAGPSTGLRDATYVGRVQGIPYATFMEDGTPLVLTREGVFAVIDDAMVPLEPPADAPAPDGPIVWLR